MLMLKAIALNRYSIAAIVAFGVGGLETLNI